MRQAIPWPIFPPVPHGRQITCPPPHRRRSGPSVPRKQDAPADRGACRNRPFAEARQGPSGDGRQRTQAPQTEARCYRSVKRNGLSPATRYTSNDLRVRALHSCNKGRFFGPVASPPCSKASGARLFGREPYRRHSRLPEAPPTRTAGPCLTTSLGAESSNGQSSVPFRGREEVAQCTA